MKHWIFSYGTLANREVAEMTGKTLNFVPALLRDHMRNFRVHIKGSYFTAAGIERRRGEETVGMLIEVPEVELEKFDEQELFYERHEVQPEFLEPLEGALPEGTYYIYIPLSPQLATDQVPLAQTYIDMVVEAFLPLDGALAQRVLSGMLDLDRPWINDREMPRYPRYREPADIVRIDALMQSIWPEHFARRIELGRHIKPELVESVLRTIAFFDLFDFPLTAEEIMNNLYKYPSPVHIKELRATLRDLCLQSRLTEIKGYYVLMGREALIETRKARKFIAEKFWNRTKLYGIYMRNVPFVEMIAVCNNLAYDNPSEQSDIDLFIVIRPGRMWLARLLITVILHFYGVRRHGDRIAGRFCLSFFVTSERLDMERFEIRPEDPYLAYWTKNLRPIYGEEMYQRFRELNRDWLVSYGLRFDESYKKHMYHPEKSSLKRFFEWVLGGLLGNLLEEFLKGTIKKRTLKKMHTLGPEASVVVSDNILKFHNHDRRQEYFNDWQRRNITS